MKKLLVVLSLLFAAGCASEYHHCVDANGLVVPWTMCEAEQYTHSGLYFVWWWHSPSIHVGYRIRGGRLAPASPRIVIPVTLVQRSGSSTTTWKASSRRVESRSSSSRASTTYRSPSGSGGVSRSAAPRPTTTYRSPATSSFRSNSSFSSSFRSSPSTSFSSGRR